MELPGFLAGSEICFKISEKAITRYGSYYTGALRNIRSSFVFIVFVPFF